MNRFNCEVFSHHSNHSPRQLCSPEGSPSTPKFEVPGTAHRLGLQWARQHAGGKVHGAEISGLVKLRGELLVGSCLNIANLATHLAVIATRGRQLSLDQQHPLFAFPRVALPGEEEDDRAFSYVVPKPLDNAKAVLADLYRQKYGIHIVPVLSPRKNEDYLRCVLRHLSAAKGQPVGFLLRVITDHRYKTVLDYEGHVLPLIIQEGDHRLDIVNLNSMGELDASYAHFLVNMRTVRDCLPGVQIQTATVRSQRQGDCHSCHTDAMQILKDALLSFRASGHSNFLEHMGIDSRLDYPDADEPRFSLPSRLQKTTQRSAALLSDAVDHTVSVSRKGESLQHHREKYSGGFGLASHLRSKSQDKVVNHFLTLKAFHNADRVVSTLEGMSSFERKRYLNMLRQQW